MTMRDFFGIWWRVALMVCLIGVVVATMVVFVAACDHHFFWWAGAGAVAFTLATSLFIYALGRTMP
jgi:hypothetical protein